MGKHQKWITILLFLGSLTGMLLGFLLLPKETFSPVENRVLAQRPVWTGGSLLDGSWMTSAEAFVSDHVPLRDQWVQLHATGERLTGKQENGGVYFGQDATLLNRVEEPDPEQVEKNIGYINTFVDGCPIPVYFGLIPSAAWVWSDRLPPNAPTAEEDRWIRACYDGCRARPIDLMTPLVSHREEAIYYRTDHHWTTLGACCGANGILTAMGLEPLARALYSPVTVSETFRGTLWSASGAWWVPPDSIETWIPQDGVRVTSWFGTEPEPGALYQEAYLTEKDQYSFFLGGNQPLCVIETDVPGDRLLVVRDSYTDALTPFLTERFSQIHLFDLRYNRLDLRAYLEEHRIDTVLILYGFSTFAEDRNLAFLSR